MENCERSVSLYYALFVCFLLSPLIGAAQFSENFEDKDLTSDPAWSGSHDLFITNEQFQLQLSAPSEGEAFLSTASKAINNASWEFSLELGFNPSSSNYTKIFLSSDKANLSESLNGYFIMVGGSEDEISLYKQKQKDVVKIIDGLNGSVNLSVVSARIKTTRDSVGNWELWVAVGDTSTLALEGRAKDAEFTSASYFGVFCEYTSTRADKFSFDNISVLGDPYKDKTPPRLVQVESTSSNTIQATFSEPLSFSTGEDAANFILEPGFIPPAQATFAKDSLHKINLLFNEALNNGFKYILKVQDLADTSGNVISEASKEFTHFLAIKPSRRSVVFNELLADPTPPAGLPEGEFIELYNNSNDLYNLAEWKISDETNTAVLQNFYLHPKNYLILCQPSDSSLYAAYGNTLGLDPWPSLNNEEETLSLVSSEGHIIDRINYNAAWYKSSVRDDGGFSLEMIDPSNPCSDAANWAASLHQKGGTPGKSNSIMAEKPDLKGPELLKIYPENRNLLLLYFNERLDSLKIGKAKFSLNNKPINGKAKINEVKPSIVFLTLESPLEAGKTYTLEIKQVYDCTGNIISADKNKLAFGLPAKADSLDLIINEVLFNPKADGVDFIEIYNNSEKYINLSHWKLANISRETTNGFTIEIVDHREAITLENFLLGPAELLAITPSMAKTLQYYPKATGKPILEVPTLPSYPDDDGTVILVDDQDRIIDKFHYEDAFHSVIVDDTEGVSLERIAYDKPTQDPQNWTSSASLNNFASPGEYNSQSRSLSGPSGNIHIEPKVIVPDNDGFKDFATIQFSFPRHGYVASIYIYDVEGRMVRRLVENATLGTEGFFTWEGVDDNNRKLRLGVYMVLFKIFNLDGELESYKEAIAIGNKF